MGTTLIIEFHDWRGVGRAGGPLGAAITFGFISVSYVPFLISEWLKARTGKMVNALKSKRFPEMDCFGEKQ